MSEANISLYDLLNLAIGMPPDGVVNFSALHSLLLAVLKQLDMLEVKTWCRDVAPGDRLTEHQPTEEEQPQTQGQVAQEGQSGTESSSSSPAPSSGPAGEEQRTLLCRIQACEDGLVELVSAQQETVPVVEKCCHRVDALEETVTSLKDTFQKYPDPEQLSQCVTWDTMQSALLSNTENLQKEIVNLRDAVPVMSVIPTHPPVSSSFTVQAARDAPSVLSPQPAHLDTDLAEAGIALSHANSTSEHSSETMETWRSISELKENCDKLQTRVAVLEEEQVAQNKLIHLRHPIANTGLQDLSNNVVDQLNHLKALFDSLMSDCEKNAELVSDVQKANLHLQAECEKLHETTRCLHKDDRQQQGQIEELYKTSAELEEKKADNQMVASEILKKADKSVLESKVSRLQFDSATEQLNTMFHELLDKVTGQERDWHRVIDKFSTEMESKLNRIELDSVKKQLEDLWKSIHESLQAQDTPEHEDAAGITKPLVDRFHCLSCGRPVVKHTSGSHLVTLPSTPGFPSHKSIRPFTVYALEQLRQHYRSERISELTDYSHLPMSRSCGGSHTVTSASQRRAAVQYMKHHSQPEADAVVQSEQVDIVGLDGHIYKGRVNRAASGNAETRLPTISAKNGMCKTKDKSRGSLSHKPAASPEVGYHRLVHHPQRPRSAQYSCSVSSISGRDWPVSALGCASQSSISQTSAAAESFSEPLDNQQVSI